MSPEGLRPPPSALHLLQSLPLHKSSRRFKFALTRYLTVTSFAQKVSNFDTKNPKKQHSY